MAANGTPNTNRADDTSSSHTPPIRCSRLATGTAIAEARKIQPTGLPGARRAMAAPTTATGR